jgi:hypothetical protein
MNAELNKFVEDVQVLIKAIGTSSSANQERDERSVENYVRGNFNTDTSNGMGGNTMENTTEPDPKGDIAVQKDLPNATRADAPAVVDQETRPYGDDTSRTPAEHNTPDVSTDGAGVYKADSEKCAACGQPMPMAKADEITKADEAKETPADEAKETPAEEAAEAKAGTEEPIKKSLWGGMFAPVK